MTVRLPLPIEDYAMIGDQVTAALVGRNGAIDWLCLPRFDGAACFAALLGDADNGSWRISPVAAARVSRAYAADSLVLETVFDTDEGTVAVIDFMVPATPSAAHNVTLIRLVQGRRGRVDMHTRLALRFDYGMSVPWVTQLDDNTGISAVAGPECVTLRTPADLQGEDMTTVATFSVAEGETMPFVFVHTASHLPVPPPIDPHAALADTLAYWREFIGRCSYNGPWKDAVHRSLLTLRALSYAATGGIVAAPTTSLPEELGGARNWDYRFCWLRDATLVLFALMGAGYTEEAASWRDWLQRSVAGSPDQVQIMYGIAGERRLAEWEVPWLAGYQGARPVRIGNAASDQVQLDVYGEVLECLHQARRHGLAAAKHGWALQRGIVGHLEQIWEQPDAGMWEIRGEPQHFTFSKIMAWVAVDRMIQDATDYDMEAPLERWCALRDRIRESVLANGFDAQLNSFVQAYGSKHLDASLLLIPTTGFLPIDDPRVAGTIAAVERDLQEGGFVMRYRTSSHVDGLAGNEGAFLACTFWLADAYALQGRMAEARKLFDRLLALRNDLGLLSEEYDPVAKRLVGNFPQAFSHVALVATAMNLSDGGPARREA